MRCSSRQRQPSQALRSASASCHSFDHGAANWNRMFRRSRPAPSWVNGDGQQFMKTRRWYFTLLIRSLDAAVLLLVTLALWIAWNWVVERQVAKLKADLS